MQPEDLPSTFQLAGNLPSTSVNFPFGRKIFRQLMSTFRAAGTNSEIFVNFCSAGRPPDNFHKLSVQPRDLPSNSVNVLCGRENIRQLLSSFSLAERSSVNLCYLLCGRDDIRKLLTNFHESRRPSNNFHQLSVWPEHLPHTLCAARRTSINFHNLSLWMGDLHATSINFLCSRETFRKLP